MTGRRKEQQRIAMRGPVLAQQGKRALGQGDVTVFGSFAMTHVEQTARTVDVGDVQVGSFLQPQTAGVDSCQTDFVTWQSDAADDLAHLFAAEDDWQLLFARRAQDAEEGPVAVQRPFVEELDAADGDGGSVAGVVFDVLDIEEVLAQFFLGDQVR